MIEISNIKLTENEAFKLYQDHKYIVTYSRIFQLNHGGTPYPYVYGSELYYKKGMSKKGTYKVMTGTEINNMLGFKLLIEQ